MSKSRTPVVLLIAALSLPLAVWQPRDSVAEHASSAIARAFEGASPMHASLDAHPARASAARLGVLSQR